MCFTQMDVNLLTDRMLAENKLRSYTVGTVKGILVISFGESLHLVELLQHCSLKQIN